MCLICDRIALIQQGKNPYFVKELRTGYVVLGDNAAAHVGSRSDLVERDAHVVAIVDLDVQRCGHAGSFLRDARGKA